MAYKAIVSGRILLEQRCEQKRLDFEKNQVPERASSEGNFRNETAKSLLSARTNQKFMQIHLKLLEKVVRLDRWSHKTEFGLRSC
ncbi:MAG: hypothetical protein PHI53_01240 [Candidatus Pacebacteria bacterium]|nr:hypothetical protein [Candidatus Paceibacterota bacterium]